MWIFAYCVKRAVSNIMDCALFSRDKEQPLYLTALFSDKTEICLHLKKTTLFKNSPEVFEFPVVQCNLV